MQGCVDSNPKLLTITSILKEELKARHWESSIVRGEEMGEKPAKGPAKSYLREAKWPGGQEEGPFHTGATRQWNR